MADQADSQTCEEEKVRDDVRAASEIMDCAVEGDHQGATLRLLAAVKAERSMALMMLTWCDLAIRATPPEDVEGKRDMTFYDPLTGKYQSPEDADPAVAWAGKFYFARVAQDEATCRALFMALNDADTYKKCVWQLVIMCAQNIRWHTTGTVTY